MIVKTPSGYVVYSEDRKKRLSKPFKSMSEAKKRLGEIEYFKHKKASEGGGYGGRGN
jgi:hypothetical protein